MSGNLEIGAVFYIELSFYSEEGRLLSKKRLRIPPLGSFKDKEMSISQVSPKGSKYAVAAIFAISMRESDFVEIKNRRFGRKADRKSIFQSQLLLDLFSDAFFSAALFSAAAFSSAICLSTFSNRFFIRSEGNIPGFIWDMRLAEAAICLPKSESMSASNRRSQNFIPRTAASPFLNESKQAVPINMLMRDASSEISRSKSYWRILKHPANCRL